MNPPDRSANERRWAVRQITGGGPETGGDIVSIGFEAEGGEAVELAVPTEMLPKLQMFLSQLAQAARAKRAELPSPFRQIEAMQPFTLTGELSIRPTDQGPLIVRCGTQEGVPVVLAVPREGAVKLGQALVKAAAETPKPNLRQ
jgi:hypothetical protein